MSWRIQESPYQYIRPDPFLLIITNYYGLKGGVLAVFVTIPVHLTLSPYVATINYDVNRILEIVNG